LKDGPASPLAKRQHAGTKRSVYESEAMGSEARGGADRTARRVHDAFWMAEAMAARNPRAVWVAPEMLFTFSFCVRITSSS